jgi:hypothetical protein
MIQGKLRAPKAVLQWNYDGLAAIGQLPKLYRMVEE